MTNLFNQSFEELLAQAGVEAPQATQPKEPEVLVVEPAQPAQPTPPVQPTQPAEPTQPAPEAKGTSDAVPSFDDLLAQAGIVSSDTTPEVKTEQPEEKPEDITEQYRVDTDIFGENDKPTQTAPNASVSFEELMAQASEPVDEPVATAEPVAEPVAKAEPVAEPVAKPVSEPVAAPVAEPVSEPVAEPVAEPVSEPVAEPVAEQVSEPVTEPVAEPVDKAEPVAEEPKKRRTRRTKKEKQEQTEAPVEVQLGQTGLIDEGTANAVTNAVYQLVRTAFNKALVEVANEIANR